MGRMGSGKLPRLCGSTIQKLVSTVGSLGYWGLVHLVDSEFVVVVPHSVRDVAVDRHVAGATTVGGLRRDANLLPGDGSVGPKSSQACRLSDP
jgi:hypothetical protein